MKITWFLFACFWSISLTANNSFSERRASAIVANTLSDQTNLAIRQVGDQLLTAIGNDTMTVPAIQNTDSRSFLLSLSTSFNYDTLPQLLHEALTDFELATESYYVTVKDCAADSVILGYDKRQFLAGKVPCIGRHQYADCNQIFVHFPDRIVEESSSFSWGYFLALLLPLLLLCFFLFKRQERKTEKGAVKTFTDSKKEWLSFGKTQLDARNQTLYFQQTQKSLTFRETKLLQYFALHANELLPRENLLENVWGDEGVLVGRSLDVFVSRLRKILKPDTSLTIKTVHGVGYRLEVVSS
ncbi:MAG: winged helix-turn-helix domain-containing protein [Bacteroidota bacterium]